MPTKPARSVGIDLDSLPGHHIHRLRQVTVAAFLQEAVSTGVTPVQFGTLHGMANAPGIDERSLARSIGLDRSTLASVIDRLQGRGFVHRGSSTADRRVQLLAMQRAQHRMLEPLPKAERARFMRKLRRIVTANNDLSRAPRLG